MAIGSARGGGAVKGATKSPLGGASAGTVAGPAASSGSLSSAGGGARSELLQSSGTNGGATPSVPSTANAAQSPLASQLASTAVLPAGPQAAPSYSPLQVGAVQGAKPYDNPNTAWKAPIDQAFRQAMAAASTPGVGITDPAAVEAARQARQQAIQAYRWSQRLPQGFQGDPNSLVPRGTTSGGVNQYFNPATGGMFVGNPFRNWNTGG